jgi:malignant T-cell-amplified sequence
LKTFVLSRTESLKLVKKIEDLWPKEAVPKIKNLKVYDIDSDKCILKSSNFTAVQINKSIILPFLGSTDSLSIFPSVNVDMGAVKFVCNGAKIMRPGITSFSFFKKGDIVTVKDEVHLKILAVGLAMEDSQSAILASKGYIIHNLHFVGDKFWEAYKQIPSY